MQKMIHGIKGMDGSASTNGYNSGRDLAFEKTAIGAGNQPCAIN